MKKIMVGQVNIAPETVAGLRSDEVPVFAWVRIAVCCAGAAEVSSHAVPLACHRLGSDVPPPSDPPGSAYPHRSAFPTWPRAAHWSESVAGAREGSPPTCPTISACAPSSARRMTCRTMHPRS